MMWNAFKLNADYLVRVNNGTEFRMVRWIPLGISKKQKQKSKR